MSNNKHEGYDYSAISFAICGAIVIVTIIIALTEN